MVDQAGIDRATVRRHGSFAIFDFPEGVHSPVVYVEGPAGNLYMERDDDLRRCNLAYSHLTAAALGPPESVKLIASIAQTTGKPDKEHA